MNAINSHILREFYYESPQSIASLSQKIGKSVPLITKGVQHLLAKGFLKDQGLAQSNGGRRANLFSIHTENLPNILLITIDQHSVTLGIYDFSNRSISENKEVKISITKNESTIDELLKEIDGFLIQNNIDQITAISITMPGFVNTILGVNTSYSKSDNRYNIRNIIEKKYHKPTFIENDSTAIAIAEHKFGAAKDIDDVLVINLNWGVGLGMIIDNKLFKGSSGFAGEFSHIPLSNLNKLCSCGKRGCLEVEASLEAALTYAVTKIERGETSSLVKLTHSSQNLNINDLTEAANLGDQLAIESFGSIGYALGKGIATLIHIINPEKIVVSGFGANIGQFLMPQIQSALLEYSIQRLSENTTVQISELNKPQLIGTMATAIINLDMALIPQKSIPETNY